MNLLLNESANAGTGFRVHRYLTGAISVLSLAFISACSSLIPPGIPSGMANPAVGGTPISAYPERLVYRIDDHRHITIKGNRSCDGTIYYYDTRLGVRTAVATTGLTLGGGAFGGHYAINSEYVAIPAIVFSQTSGVFLYIYYSNNGGRTFKSFWGGADVSGKYSSEENLIILDGKYLYAARRERDTSDKLYLARIYDLSQEVAVDEFRHAVPPNGRYVDPKSVPLEIRSPSGLTKWSCEGGFDQK